ncbi:MAG: 4'-phosphopantetheinyl transferase superfamily protein [Oscillibacter sp.]|nr:4'-phosphopantetheinyl transferase superfamily protein [Oscillibacter sp.]
MLIYTCPFGGGAEESHRLLYRAAAQYTGAAECRWTISHGPKGKPHFTQMTDVHFSITHSGAFWMCAFSDRPVGLDLQKHQPCQREKLSKRFFHPWEDAFLNRRGYLNFFELWTAKESYVKYTGQGITEELENFSVVSQTGEFPHLAGVQFRLLPWQKEYALCLCAQEIGAVHLTEL